MTKTVLHHLFLFLLPVIVAGNFSLCSNKTTPALPGNSSYDQTLLSLLNTLSTSASSSRFHSLTSESSEGEVIQGLYQCRGDIPLESCLLCVVTAAKGILQLCSGEKSAVIWYDMCLLRYSNESIVSKLAIEPFFIRTNHTTISDEEQPLFQKFVGIALNDTAKEAIKNPGPKFLTKETNTYGNFSETKKIYSMVQCTEDLSPVDCDICLLAVTSLYPRCCGSSVGGRFLLPSCFFRYEIYQFYESGIGMDPTPLSPEGAPVAAPFSPEVSPVPPEDDPIQSPFSPENSMAPRPSPSSVPKKASPSLPVVPSSFGSPHSESSSGRRKADHCIMAAIVGLVLFFVAKTS